MKINAKIAQIISSLFFLTPLVLVAILLAVTLVIKAGPLGWFFLGVCAWLLASAALHQWSRRLLQDEIYGRQY